MLSDSGPGGWYYRGLHSWKMVGGILDNQAPYLNVTELIKLHPKLITVNCSSDPSCDPSCGCSSEALGVGVLGSP